VAKAWLARHSWEAVTAINEQLCAGGSAFHGPTSDGHEDARTLWEANHQREMSLQEAVELCRRCHRIAPFCFFNGNTFAAIIKMVTQTIQGLDARDTYALRSICSHIVAGTATPEEGAQFQEMLSKLR
jgi:hypothetical protein